MGSGSPTNNYKIMKEKNTIKEIIIENDTEFYGFLTGSDIMTAAEVVRYLRIKAKCHIHNGDLERDVVEEIVRRGGTFYTGTEAKPKNPAYAECNWLVIDIAQYMYGMYLQQKIEKGELTIEELISK